MEFLFFMSVKLVLLTSSFFFLRKKNNEKIIHLSVVLGFLLLTGLWCSYEWLCREGWAAISLDREEKWYEAYLPRDARSSGCRGPGMQLILKHEYTYSYTLTSLKHSLDLPFQFLLGLIMFVMFIQQEGKVRVFVTI